MRKRHHFTHLAAGLAAVLAGLSCSSRPLSAGQAVGASDTLFSTTTKDLRSGQIPEAVFRMPHLRQLAVKGDDCDYRVVDDRGNDITRCWTISVIPAEIGQLTELVSLRLPLNAIERVPPEIGRLKRLRIVDLSDNLPLTDISSLCDVENLEELSLCGCNLSSLPARIGMLKHLKKLCLAGTRLGAAEQQRLQRLLPGCEITF